MSKKEVTVKGTRKSAEKERETRQENVMPKIKRVSIKKNRITAKETENTFGLGNKPIAKETVNKFGSIVKTSAKETLNAFGVKNEPIVKETVNAFGVKN